jgi:NADH-quinone oxidoreductase subunit D/NADH-quinone oxidoreductase subunit C/D
VDFDIVIGTNGDCLDRYYVRIEEMRQSLKIIEQLIDNIPDGPYSVIKFNVKIVLPEGTYYGQVETARGILGVFIVSDGKSEKPCRLHFRSPNFNNLWAVTQISPGWRIADLIAIQSSLDLVVPDIDR